MAPTVQPDRNQPAPASSQSVNRDSVKPQAKPSASQGTKGQTRARKQGMASWYGPGFHGRRTASGERFNSGGYTAAHRYLPFGTRVRVTNTRNGRSVVVRINDRGPFSGGRVIDLSTGAARAIGVFQSGVAPVVLEVLGR
ncbi:septal ring lytic transglycosylase RlpA family protein [Pannus brasiliensis CCIBt3594]|uniref:Probable endolytic peptidoglycan transglycosylase RlpA n=1 Tax=Pannus brasiliensis CCIBt3594 TaxID=1427578 RepID=A0AAW9QHK8_9CHRO